MNRTSRTDAPPRIKTARVVPRSASPTACLGIGLVALGLMLLSGAPTSESAVEDEGHGLALISRYNTGQPRAVAVADDLAFVGLDTGIEIYSLVDARDPRLVGTVYLSGPANRMAHAEGFVYAACGERGLQIVDAADPGSPARAGSLLMGVPLDVDVVGTVAYVADAGQSDRGAPGLRTVDVSEREAPRPMGFLALPNVARAVIVAGTLAYVGLGSEQGGLQGLAVVDVSEPDHPALVAMLGTEKAVNDIILAGDYAVLATGFSSTGSVVAVDVSEPSAPHVLARHALLDAARALALDGEALHVAAGITGLVTFDATRLPELRPLASFANSLEVMAVSACRKTIYLGSRGYNLEGAFSVVTTLSSGFMREEAVTEYSDATDVFLSDGLAFFLSRNALQVFEANAGEETLHEIGSWSSPGGYLTAAAVQGTLAAVGDGSTIKLLDVSVPAEPVLLRAFPLRSRTRPALRVVISGDDLYVVNGRGYEVYDITNPLAPVFLGAYEAQGYASDLFVAAPVGYLTAGSELQILDLTSPESPVLLGTYKAPDDLYAVKIRRDLAVVSGIANIATLLDVSTPSRPRVLGRISGGDGYDIALSERHALVAAGKAGVLAVSLHHPTRPVVVGRYDTAGQAAAVAVAGRRAVVAAGMAQHWALDCLVCDTAPPLLAQARGGSGRSTRARGVLDGASSPDRPAVVQ